MDSMLIDARQAASVGNVSRSFVALECFVVGFKAKVAHPRRYIYQGCTMIVSNGRYCSKSVAADGKCPDHAYLAEPISKAMFRFDIFLADGSVSKCSCPLRAVIFAAAQDLVKNGSIIVTELHVDADIVETLPAFSKRVVSQTRPPEHAPDVDKLIAHARSNLGVGCSTPPRRKSTTVSPCVYKTPRSEFLQRSATSRGESSSSFSRSNVNVEDLLLLRKQFDDLLNRSLG